MNRDLEFELEVENKCEKIITYRVLRKGLMVGLLILDAPYNKEELEKHWLIAKKNLV